MLAVSSTRVTAWAAATVYNGGARTQFDVKGGFADVNGEGLTILAEEASELTAN